MNATANPIHIPALEHHCGSWIATRIADNSVVGEFFERNNLLKLNPKTIRVETAAQYLGRVNKELREQREKAAQKH